MDYNQVKELIGIIQQTDFTNFELTIDGVSVIMQRGHAESKKLKNADSAEMISNIDYKTTAATDTSVVKQAELPKEEIKGNIIKSPIVGTFYESASPDKPPFIKIGDRINKGDVVCIVEAMKFMNEIVSEYSGIVEEIYATDQDMVEFDQPLYKIV